MRSKETGLTGYENRAYTPQDLEEFGKTQGFTINELVEVFCPGGMGSSAFMKNLRKSEKLPAYLQMLLRMYLCYPESMPEIERITSSDFFDNELGGEDCIALRFRGYLFGVDRNCGYNWGKDAEPIASIKADMMAAKRLREKRQWTQAELLEVLLDVANTTSAMLTVNPMKTTGWKSKATSGQALQLNSGDVAEKAVKNRGRRVSNAAGPALKDINVARFAKITRIAFQNANI